MMTIEEEDDSSFFQQTLFPLVNNNAILDFGSWTVKMETRDHSPADKHAPIMPASCTCVHHRALLASSTTRIWLSNTINFS